VSLDQFCVASQAQTSLKGSSEAKFVYGGDAYKCVLQACGHNHHTMKKPIPSISLNKQLPLKPTGLISTILLSIGSQEDKLQQKHKLTYMKLIKLFWGIRIKMQSLLGNNKANN